MTDVNGQNLDGLSRAEVEMLARNPRAPRARRRAARAYLAALARQAVETAKEKLRAATPALTRLASRIGMAREPEVETSPIPVTVSRVTRYPEIRGEYDAMYAAARVSASNRIAVDKTVASIVAGRDRYQAVARATGAPWGVVGVIHGLEAGFSFARHLHNGDSLSERTRHVPAGRPVAGSPPFTWEESAIDALSLTGVDRVEDWPVSRALFELERYNGFGYRLRGLPSPYLWSFTDQYARGKYTADGAYDADAVSRQVGGAAILKRMAETGVDFA